MTSPLLTAYSFLSPLMPGVLRLLATGNRSLRKFADVRLGLFGDLDRKLASATPFSCRLWIHASSTGEFEQARPIIAGLKRIRPDIDVVVSFLSDSGYEARKDYADASAVFYLPLDTPGNARRLVALIRPDIFMLMRYDFWPNHLEAIRKSGAKLLLAAATLPPGSPYFRPLLHGLYRNLFSLFDRIYTISDEDKDLFRNRFGCHEVIRAGDPRFDQVSGRMRLGDERTARLKRLFTSRMVLVGGSVWPPDEELLLPAWIPFRNELSLVLVPHQVERPGIERILESLGKRGIAAVTVSTLVDEDFDPKTQVLVVDQTGYLAELYAIASLAWVGGAFGVNVHNTIEPAVHGIPVLFGPKYGNSPEASGLLEAGGAMVFRDETPLREAIGRFIGEPEFLKRTGRLAGEFVRSRLGATETIVNAIVELAGS